MREHPLPQLLQATIVMIANIPKRLIEARGNLAESVALEKVETQSITLIFG
jgi:hypothetical protein